MVRTARRALVTGANRGLGREVCAQLLALGWRVIGTVRDLGAASSSLGLELETAAAARLHLLELDLEAPQSISAACQSLDAFGPVDLLVNNAGVYLDDGRRGKAPRFPGLPLDMLRATFEVNVWGALAMMQHVAARMVAQGGGTIVNVASGMGRCCEVANDAFAYRLSKSTLLMATRLAARALVDTRVHVLAACPGWVSTDMGGPEAPLSVVEGARNILAPVLEPVEGPRGTLWRGRQILECGRAAS